MRSKKEIEELLNALERHQSRYYWFCITCKKPAKEECHWDKHVLVLGQPLEHEGILEWIRCLRWVLEKEVPEYETRPRCY